jgi:hypothetical protein
VNALPPVDNYCDARPSPQRDSLGCLFRGPNSGDSPLFTNWGMPDLRPQLACFQSVNLPSALVGCPWFYGCANVGSGSLLYTGCILNQRKHGRIRCREAEWRGIVPSGGGSQELASAESL